MAEKTLEERIEQRKKQATDRHIYSKAMMVALYLGSGENSDDDTNMSYHKDGFDINYTNGVDHSSDGDMPYFGATVKYKNEVVFKMGGGDITSYVPGTRTWEPKLNKLYAQAEAVAKDEKEKSQQRAAADKDRERAELARKWGL